MRRRRWKRVLIGAFAGCAVLADAGAAAAQAAASTEQLAISTPPAGSAAWVEDHSFGQSMPDPATTTPAAAAEFFASLAPTELDRLIRDYPLVVGNFDGAPVDLRYRANRIALAAERDRARARAADRKLDSEQRALAVSRANDVEHLLASERQVLAFDPRGRGLVTEVWGDLADADRIAVLVPGSDADLGHFDQAAEPLRSPAGMARALYAEEHRQAPGTRTAVIAWTGYVTPSGLGPDAVTSRLADVGAPRLERLLAGLKETTRPDAPPSLLCHSYGSVVCGSAAPEIPRAAASPSDTSGITDLMVFGSPGMGVQSTAELGAGVHVWATRNGSDWIGNVPYLEVGGLGHGADPTSTDFGAEQISSARSSGHNGYFAEGTDSLHNFAAVSLGRYENVVRPPADTP
ncbi:alpha/beta hydrolase [Kitasatospora sp. CM 4170]|uniref:Alpha/beta hydrolase n=1 Tax=Kitasatospora aburaviensis TaxID=67265 RepID=A0ABW1ER68_9ACTN|nr:alpha/beta hydrolase [Kitasatospora sp. CM 4170]WNM45659.1 alpha/beta hydrolase [Kitasatospora sp. CM 4170]